MNKEIEDAISKLGKATTAWVRVETVKKAVSIGLVVLVLILMVVLFGKLDAFMNVW